MVIVSTGLAEKSAQDAGEAKSAGTETETGSVGDVVGGVGEVRREAPGEAEGVSEEEVPRRASCRERLRMTSDFIEEGRFSPCNFR